MIIFLFPLYVIHSLNFSFSLLLLSESHKGDERNHDCLPPSCVPTNKFSWPLTNF